ncbi:hypothetical protein [Streptomyces sp. KL116D]|uniref:hypothetical protein n=1 Tax=Streptomyces sp. KL116D TaxID=3045152 RepID=UPI0035575911
MATATPTPVPLTPAMTFATASGASVEVLAVAGPSPYRWSCTAGHRSEVPFGSLPFCRDAAKVHAGECPGVVDVFARQRAIEQAVSALRFGESTVVNGTTVTAVDLATAEAIRTHGEAVRLADACRSHLAGAGLLHLIGGDV